jgi:peptidoglycan/LPS O-acetylase OafA/YrhL
MAINPQLAGVLLVGAIGVAVFSFLSVSTWASQRRREREAYYQSLTFRKIAQSQGAGGNSALEFLREEERIGARRRREGHKLGGLVTIAVGIGLMIFLAAVDRGDREPAYLLGVIPLLIGGALLVYAYLLGPKE